MTRSNLTWTSAQITDVDDLLMLEREVAQSPWTYGNFADVLVSGYDTRLIRHQERVIAYWTVMPVVDEAHLLNIAVARAWQGRGLATDGLRLASAAAQKRHETHMLLEVRPSNQTAVNVYRRLGFVQIGLRRAYYPDQGSGREDAWVMRAPLPLLDRTSVSGGQA